MTRRLVYGASTAAYQIEGAVTADGRGRSVWDTFAAEPGRILDGSTGEVACDHYHRLEEDLALMRDLGLQGYRFSIAWPRILPEGRGAVNPAGLDFYDRLVDGLLAAGVAPMATLFHWDLPQSLHDQGGWRERRTVDAFADYAAVVAGRLADRVAYWCPVNEPNVLAAEGYAFGTHAPGETDPGGALTVAHHLLLAHGRAVEVLRAAGAKQVGTATNHAPVWPATPSEADRAVAATYDVLWNRLFADPVLLGTYPDPWADQLPVLDGDLETISAPLDFYGINYYVPVPVAAAPMPTDEAPTGTLADLVAVTGQGAAFPAIPDVPTTDFGWPVVPEGLTELLVQMHERYPSLPPIHITENGCAYSVGPDADGRVRDQARIAYLEGHLAAVETAIERGVDVRGYWTWSLLDNFEWAAGYTQRFGLVYVDYATQQRIPKDSYAWYRDHIARRS